MSGSAGSWALFGAKPPREATVVRKLREAGAIILASANCSEYSNSRSTNFVNGWSPRGGKTRGLFAEDHMAGGSSSGSAVSTALGLCFAALGTETAGSILNPSRHNNLVGIKPTPGITSRDGVIPVSCERDSVGPLARTVTDAVHLLDAIAGEDESDMHSLRVPADKRPKSYIQACQSTSLQGLRIGVPRNSISDQIDPAYLYDFEQVLKVLQKQGAVVIDSDYPAGQSWNDVDASVKDLCVLTEFRRDMNSYLGAQTINPNNIKTLEDLIAYTKSDPRECIARYDVERFEMSAKTEGVEDPAYLDAASKEAYYGGPGGIDGAIDAHDLDVLVAPASWFHEQLLGNRRYPCVTVPIGCYPEETAPQYFPNEHDKFIGAGIPYVLSCLFSLRKVLADLYRYSVYVFGKSYSEENLIRVAYTIEQCFQKSRQPAPLALPKVDLCDLVGLEAGT